MNIIKDKDLFIKLDKDLDINVEAGKTLRLNNLNIGASLKLNIYLKDNSKLIFNNSLILKEDITLEINIYHRGKNIITRVKNHILNLGSNSKIIVNLVHESEYLGGDSSQDNKVINLDGSCVVRPFLIVENSESVAEHAAFIGSFDKERLFYLMSRGLSLYDSTYLMLKSFLLAGIPESSENINFIKEQSKCLEKILKY